MSLYTKALKHIDMNRVKELREEKIKRKKIADEIREQIREELRNLSSPEFSNWREGIAEGMTSSGMFNTTLPAQGDVDLGDVTSPIIGGGSSPGYSQSGNTYTSGPANAGIPPEVNGGFIIDIDTSEFDTLVFELSPGTIDSFEIIAARGGSQFTDYTLSTSAGRKVLSLKSVDRKKGVSFAFSFSKSSGGSIGTNVIRNLTFQRRTPMNVFVSLDSPEATNFIRTDPSMQGLSAEDRKKKLMDMLDAGDEYMLKYLGLTGSSARPSDVTMPDSWEQASETQPAPKNDTEKFADDNGLPRDYVDKLTKANAYFHNNLRRLPQRVDGKQLERMNDLMRKGYEREGFTKDQIDTIERKQLVKNTYGASPSYKPEPEPKSSNNSSGLTNAELAALAKRDGLPYYGTAGSDASKSSPKNTSTSRNTSTSDPFMNIRVGNTNNANTSTSSGGKDYGNIASADWPNANPSNNPLPIIPYDNPNQERMPGANPPIRPQNGGKFPFARTNKKQKSVVAHHEPKGEVLSEKKKLKSVKDVTSKIPGYYDGKPAPLGFPMQEPPKMVNGFHPDLVDGKKIANRFNRLDPQSAKAMPPTGNPHIDKKVRAAAKKPK
jgi:hypothetical protein